MRCSSPEGLNCWEGEEKGNEYMGEGKYQCL